MYCVKQQSVFGRLFKIDCQKHTLEHCVIGLFGWMNINVQTSDLEQHLNFETEYGINQFRNLSVPRRKH